MGRTWRDTGVADLESSGIRSKAGVVGSAKALAWRERGEREEDGGREREKGRQSQRTQRGNVAMGRSGHVALCRPR